MKCTDLIQVIEQSVLTTKVNATQLMKYIFRNFRVKLFNVAFKKYEC